MFSAEPLVVAHLGHSAGRVGFRHTSYCCTPQVWQVLSVLEHPVLQQNSLWEVSRRCLLAICFVSVFRFRHALFPFTQAGSFSPLLNPSLLHTFASRRGGLVVIGTAVLRGLARPFAGSFMTFTNVLRPPLQKAPSKELFVVAVEEHS